MASIAFLPPRAMLHGVSSPHLSALDGYRTDIAYTAHHQPELNPARLAMAAPGRFIPDRPFSAIDLGCGYGLSALFHAAAYPHASFIGVDARGTHVSWATGMATAADLDNASFIHATFADVMDRLPTADLFIAHGIWSWVADDVRRQTLALAVAKLKPGGIFYVSYNALPGMAALLPVREQLVVAFERTSGPVEQRIATAFAETITAFADQPKLVTRIRRLASASPSYLAHEFFNQHWRCFTAAEVAQECAAAGLGFVGPAGLRAAETAEFRADLFAREDGMSAAAPAFANMEFALMIDGDAFARVAVTTPTAQRLLHRLARAPASVEGLAAEPLFASVPRATLESAVMELFSLYVIEPVLAPPGLDQRHARTDRLNRALWAQAIVSDDISAAVSPVTGSGLHTSRIEQIFLAAMVRQGDPVATATDIIGSEHTAEISSAFARFEARRLPLLKSLGVI